MNSSKGAIISYCQKYRYALWRNWDLTKDKVMFIGLNPSTADHIEDDPTIRRCINFAKSWGYGGLYMTNLFSYRTSNPDKLRKAKDPIGNPKNDEWIKKLYSQSSIIIAAWGNLSLHKNRKKEISHLCPNMHCLKTNKTGNPGHPLYQPSNLKPVKFVSSS